jgi:hypothetical protein
MEYLVGDIKRQTTLKTIWEAFSGAVQIKTVLRQVCKLVWLTDLGMEWWLDYSKRFVNDFSSSVTSGQHNK